MKFKRLFAAVLCVILSLCVFAGGCGLFGGPSDNNENDKPDKPSVEQPVEDEGVFTITFNAGAYGTLSSTTMTTEDGKLAVLPTHTLIVSSNYTFLGWYTEETGGEKVTVDYTYTADTTLYAHYQQNQINPEPAEYTITLNVGALGSLSGSAATLTTVNGKIASLPTPKVYGDYTFLGWYTDKSGGEKITADYTYTADTTLYAHYQQNQVVEYTVTLNAGTLGTLPAGTATKLTTVKGKIASLPEPTVSSKCTFLGWYTDKSGGVKVTADYKYTADTALYAHYQQEVEQADPAKFLKADGRDVKTQDGEIIYLRGVNAGGLFVTEEWMTGIQGQDYKSATKTLIERFGEQRTKEIWAEYRANWWSDIDFQNCAEMGMNVIRLPFTYMNVDFGAIMNYDNAGNYDFSALDEFVSKAAQYGMYTILDLHGAYGSQNGQDHSGQEFKDKSDVDFYTNERMQTLTVNLWSALAEHYKDNSAVAGYDILNEPGEKAGSTGEAHWKVFDKIYKAIRAEGDEHMIIFESCWEWYNLPNPSQYSWENCMYSFHHYVSDQLSVDEHLSNWQGKLSGIENNCNLPLQMGEFTAYGSQEKWEKTFELLNSHNWHYTSWTYKTWNCGSWGIYSVSGDKVNPSSDSYDSIINKIKKMGTAGATKHTFSGGKTLEALFKYYLKDGYEDPVVQINKVGLINEGGKAYAVFSGTCKLNSVSELDSYVIDGEISGRVKLTLEVTEYNETNGTFVLKADLSAFNNNGRYYLHAGFGSTPENLPAETAKTDTANSTVTVGGKTYSVGEEWGCRQIVVT